MFTRFSIRLMLALFAVAAVSTFAIADDKKGKSSKPTQSSSSHDAKIQKNSTSQKARSSADSPVEEIRMIKPGDKKPATLKDESRAKKPDNMFTVTIDEWKKTTTAHKNLAPSKGPDALNNNKLPNMKHSTQTAKKNAPVQGQDAEGVTRGLLNIASGATKIVKGKVDDGFDQLKFGVRQVKTGESDPPPADPKKGGKSGKGGKGDDGGSSGGDTTSGGSTSGSETNK